MHRLFRLSFMALLIGMLAYVAGSAQTSIELSGGVAAGQVRLLTKDPGVQYHVAGKFVVAGTLIIEPGVEIYFFPNSYLIDSCGGRIIADGSANAQYFKNPGGIDPRKGFNSNNWKGYADLDYFLYENGGDKTIGVGTPRELTVHPDKYNHIFNVVLNKTTRQIKDLPVDGTLGTNEVIIPFEKALLYEAVGLADMDTLNNPRNEIPWSRLNRNSTDTNINAGQITFIGKRMGELSVEWGHIIILPGARAAFFRNCEFRNFRKDTNAFQSNMTLYKMASFPVGMTTEGLKDLNKEIWRTANGCGGAITTYSSRTWLVGCKFDGNFARINGGAVQVLQAPTGYPVPSINLANYPADKNPNLIEKDGTLSPENSTVKAIDFIDENSSISELTFAQRQPFDDGRLAIFLGRMRNLDFENNQVLLCDLDTVTIDGLLQIKDMTNRPAKLSNMPFRNQAFGGALYISGRENDPAPVVMGIGLGINTSINTVTAGTLTLSDGVEFLSNLARNFQNQSTSKGARGGAIYIGENTSLIVKGKFTNNKASADSIEADPARNGYEKGTYSLGGAIYLGESMGRLQIRGGASNSSSPTTLFDGNKAGFGGAIYVGNNNANTPKPSPIIGGTDLTPATRDLGLKIKFIDNTAISSGGAIFTKRNFTVCGGGGVVTNINIAYGSDYNAYFANNTAGYAGGAITSLLSNMEFNNTENFRAIQLTRAIFLNNEVGMQVSGTDRNVIRGGGAIYTLNADINLIKAVDFIGNKVKNGNGGALAIVNPNKTSKRYFITDLDQVTLTGGVASNFVERNDIFTFNSDVFKPHTGMLTKFQDNEISWDEDVLTSQSGSGTTQVGIGTILTNQNLNSIVFGDNTHGIAAGNNGTIIQLTSDGSNWFWDYRSLSSGKKLNDAAFVTGTRAVVAGEQGLIMKSDDKGVSWTTARSAVYPDDIKSVTFVSTTYGIAVGQNGLVLYTADGGTTWNEDANGRFSTLNLNGVYFTNPSTAYIVGERGMVARGIKVTDNSWNWTAMNMNTTINFNDVYFVNINVGYVVGNNNTIYYTANGGTTWERRDQTNTGFNLTGVRFSTVANGFAYGSNGKYLKTSDSGRTWVDINVPFAVGKVGTINNMAFTSFSSAYLAADNGSLFKSSDGGMTWAVLLPANPSVTDVRRYHPEPTFNVPENGIGLGGAIYILERQLNEIPSRNDSIMFSRVRIQNNVAYTGAAVYSDNYNLHLVFQKSLITGNLAKSEIGANQNAIRGALVGSKNKASSDLAGAVLYGEVEGPLPSTKSPEAANSIYNNKARFLIRLPDAPNTKGLLAGNTGAGEMGADSLLGNYWGLTQANLTMQIELNGYFLETFFIDTDGENRLRFVKNSSDLLDQGPFESKRDYSYRPIPLKNGTDENTPDLTTSIPEKLLFSGRIYDMYDKQTDIKVANYSNRRMAPVEDFSVGMVRGLKLFTDYGKPSYGKYVKRWLKDPYICEIPEFSLINQMQDEFKEDSLGILYHPLGYPVFLESKVDYDGPVEISNEDPRLQNEAIFFGINERTGDYIRVFFRQDTLNNEARKDLFRARLDLVPDLTARPVDPNVRKVNEGIAYYGNGKELLSRIQRNPYTEDKGALPGRRYEAAYNMFANEPNLFKNRPSMPASNNGVATFYAGERFNALPVNVGDTVRIISRTILWKFGWDTAMKQGIHFVVSNSTRPAEFTGNVNTLKERNILSITPSLYPWKDFDTTWNDDYLNTVYVSEDRPYPVSRGTYSFRRDGTAGRDSIFAASAIDRNLSYDPRSYFVPNSYARLTYKWSVDANSGLKNWLDADVKPASSGTFYGADGYMVFKGRPTNPYIVPGGEDVDVLVENYPPHYRLLDSLRSAGGIPENVIKKFTSVFPPYFNTWKYDESLARFLQQDTIDCGLNYTTKYKYKLFVVDSLPKFFGTVVDDRYEIYRPSVFSAGLTNDGRVKANLTNKLRFQIDINTDDELEDSVAQIKNWDFRFGKTAYGFENRAIRQNPDEDVTLDSYQIRPYWMKSDYIYKYGGETEKDPYGIDFLTKGKLNVRIDSLTAVGMLTPAYSYNGSMITDTAMSIVANDGHGGTTVKQYNIFINYAPYIVNSGALPKAKEDFEYNKIDETNNQLVDTNKRIKIVDANFGQEHFYMLVYDTTTIDNLLRVDPNFADAGTIDLTNLKHTPRWLRINSTSGMLYGVPGVKDAPRLGDKKEKVTVIVWDKVDDQLALPTVKVLDLEVDSTHHATYAAQVPGVSCWDKSRPYSDTLWISDRDLLRGKVGDDAVEHLTVTVVKPTSGITINPPYITGPFDTEKTKIAITALNLKNVVVDEDGKLTITIRITDDGNPSVQQYFFTYRIQLSDSVHFVAPLKVENSKGSVQYVEFGIAPSVSSPTTGFGNLTSAADTMGNLDNNLCEFELPPPPFEDMFDVRWIIPTTKGILRNIYPAGATGLSLPDQIFRATFNAGGDAGTNYPVTISWLRTDIPAVNDAIHNPVASYYYLRDPYSQGNFFNINMRDGHWDPATKTNEAIAQFSEVGDMISLQITDANVKGFVIVQTYNITGITDPIANNQDGIVNVTPNPVANEAMISFNTMKNTKARMEIIDMLGNVVAVVADGTYEKGQNQLYWNAKDSYGKELPTGVYTCRLTTDYNTTTYKINIVK